MQPRRLLFLLHMPIKAVRLITDPIVDGILWFIRPALSHLYQIFMEVWKLKAAETARSHIKLDTLYAHSLHRLQQFTPLFRLSHSTAPSPSPLLDSVKQSLQTMTPSWLLKAIASKAVENTAASSGEPTALRSLLESIASSWRHLAVEDGPREQIFAIWIGYVAILGGSLLFLSSGVMFNGATRIVRNLITQQLIVLKVRPLGAF